MINNRPHVRHVQGDGARGAGGEHQSARGRGPDQRVRFFLCCRGLTCLGGGKSSKSPQGFPARANPELAEPVAGKQSAGSRESVDEQLLVPCLTGEPRASTYSHCRPLPEPRAQAPVRRWTPARRRRPPTARRVSPDRPRAGAERGGPRPCVTGPPTPLPRQLLGRPRPEPHQRRPSSAPHERFHAASLHAAPPRPERGARLTSDIPHSRFPRQRRLRRAAQRGLCCEATKKVTGLSGNHARQLSGTSIPPAVMPSVIRARKAGPAWAYAVGPTVGTPDANGDGIPASPR